MSGHLHFLRKQALFVNGDTKPKKLEFVLCHKSSLFAGEGKE